jgi:hypothetical protein
MKPAMRTKHFGAPVLPGLLMCLLMAAPAFGSTILYSIGNGNPFNPLTPGGTFNTGTNTACGVGASCNQSGAFSYTDGPTGVTVTGNVSFTTTDVGGVTTQALMDISGVTIDNPGDVSLVNVAIAFLSDQIDPTAAATAGVAETGYFASDSNPNNSLNGEAQGRMYEQTGAWLSNVPVGFGVETGQAFATNQIGPIPFTLTAQTPTISAQTQLIGLLTLSISQGTEMVLPGSFLVEIGDTAAVGDATVPEPSTWMLLGTGLAMILLRKRY